MNTSNKTSTCLVTRTRLRLTCWKCGFESRRECGCLFLVHIIFCKVNVSAKGRSHVQSTRTECGVLMSVIRCNNNPVLAPCSGISWTYKHEMINLFINKMLVKEKSYLIPLLTLWRRNYYYFFNFSTFCI